MPYLDFKYERDTEGDSWQRADPRAALIEQIDPTTYLVLLPGGSTHECSYGTERGGYVGFCDCKGWQFRDDDDSPCAHLCTLRKAEFIDEPDAHGHPVTAESTMGEIEPGATEPEPEIRVDGGRRDRRHREPRDGESYDRSGNIRPVPPHVDPTPARADGQTFGRPEDQL